VKRVRGGSGLGDAIYVRVIAEHLARLGHEITACSDQAEVFIGAGVEVAPFSRERIAHLAHYTQGKNDPRTTQWQDVCRSAGVGEIPLSFHWEVRNQLLVTDLKAMARGKPIVVVHGGRPPMARTDGFGAELLPKRAAFDAVLDAMQGCFMVEVGKGTELYPLRADVDLNGRTTVSDLLDIFWICDAAVGQCSFVVPLAECFDKPLLAIWASHGMEATRHPYVRSITPQKVLSKSSSRFVVDDWPIEKLQEAARAFCAMVGSR
jgi:hypothetical protein